MSGCAWEGLFTATQRKRWHEAIAIRFSCRKFSGPADIEHISALHYLAARAKLPGVRLVFSQGDSNALFVPLPFVKRIEYATQFAAVIADKRVPGVMLHAGVMGEALCLEAAHLSLGTCWVGGGFRRKALGIAAESFEKVVAVIPFGKPLDPSGASKRKRKPLTALCHGDPAAWPLWAYDAAEAVRAAPSAFNSQPWRFSFSGSTLMLTGRGFGGLSFGIAALHIDCALHPEHPRWRMGLDKKCLLVSIEEDHDAV